jgi:putative membrane protein
MGIQDLPALNASLNALAAVFLTAGYVLIRKGHGEAHKRCMLAALATSSLFLISYVVYHANVGSRPYGGQGAVRLVYFAILITHVVLAAAVVPLALVTANRGLKNRLDAHVGIARWTLPIWLYVSVTGVVIYLMLYW